jgi:hypothetical protein
LEAALDTVAGFVVNSALSCQLGRAGGATRDGELFGSIGGGHRFAAGASLVDHCSRLCFCCGDVLGGLGACRSEECVGVSAGALDQPGSYGA